MQPQMVVVVGISFNLIIIRVQQGIALRGASAENGKTLTLKFVSQPTTLSAASGAEEAISREIAREVRTDYNEVLESKLHLDFTHSLSTSQV